MTTLTQLRKTARSDVQLHLPAAEADELLAAHPTAARLTRGATPIGVRVPLGDTAAAGDVGDLSKAIGRPATQALISAGITTLTQVAELTEAELLAMHGVGPKAVRVLSESLSATGRRLKG